MTNDSQKGLFIIDRSKSLLPANQPLVSLAPGQMAILDLDKQLSAGASTKTNNFAFAMGIGTGSVLEDILIGPEMQVRGNYEVAADCYKPPVPNLISLHDFKVACDTTYSIQLVVRTNESNHIQGSLPIRKSYPVLTACCESPCECSEGNCSDLGIRYARAMMNDNDRLVNVWLVNNDDALDAQADRIDPFDQAAINALIETHVAQGNTANSFCFALHIEPIVEKMNEFCGVVYKGGHEWNTAGLPFYQVELATTVGHDCMGKITTIREAVYGGTNVHDINQLEYFLQGRQGLPLGTHRVFADGQPIGGGTVQPKQNSYGFSVISIGALNTHKIGFNDRTHGAGVQLFLPCDQSGAGPITAIKDFLVTNELISATAFDVAINCTCV